MGYLDLKKQTIDILNMYVPRTSERDKTVDVLSVLICGFSWQGFTTTGFRLEGVRSEIKTIVITVSDGNYTLSRVFLPDILGYHDHARIIENVTTMLHFLIRDINDYVNHMLNL